MYFIVCMYYVLHFLTNKYWHNIIGKIIIPNWNIYEKTT